jgi:hypothetical protein
MPLTTRQNEYLGVNAHLHSYFQAHGGWEGFHGVHIGDLAKAITRALPSGYIVDTEQSLQLREIHPDTGERIRRPMPDVTVFRTGSPAPIVAPITAEGATATLVQPVIKTMQILQEKLYYRALLIYEATDGSELGTPVTRIELLSPSNKFGDGLVQYTEKRVAALKTGLRLIEMDYLHETDPVMSGLPSYIRRETGAYAYNITISDPNPSVETGLSTTHWIDVDQPLPTLPIPLGNNESFMLDFNTVYHETYNSINAYSYRVDYARLPERAETYSTDDLARIQTRMATVAAATLSN